MPNITGKKSRQQYSSAELAAAAEEYKKGAKISLLARQFNVPYPTLHYKLKKTFAIGR